MHGGLLLVFTLSIVAWLSYYVLVTSKRPPLPPGPRGHLIFGMTFRFPKHHPWLQLAEWAKEYGPIMHMRVGLQHVIVVSDGHTSRELIDNRSKIYSDRPFSKVGETLTRGMRSVLMQYGDDLKRVRRVYNKIISSRKCDAYNGILQAEAIATMQFLIEDEQNFAENISRYALSVARSIAFSKRVQTAKEPVVGEIKKLGSNFSNAMVAGKYIVEDIPLLQKLPKILKPWVRELEQLRDWEEEFLIREYRSALAAAKLHPERPSVARDVDNEMKSTGGFSNSELHAAHTCMEILSTGSETTASSILALIQACVANPEVVKKAHQELDERIGQGRYPTWEDEPNLPYIRAMIKEQHRWRTVSPMSFSHRANAEDVYNGYRIPKNSTVRLNTWAMQMDSQRYPEPEKFMPERFLQHHLSAASYANSHDVDARDHFSYGNGRRVCPGIHLAERSLFNIVSHLLHTFDIRPALDAHGKEVPVDIWAYSNTLICGAEPFKARFIVRGEEIAKTLNKSWLAKFGNGPVESWLE